MTNHGAGRFAMRVGAAAAVFLCGLRPDAAMAANEKSLAQLLSERAATDGFTVQGLDLLGNEPTPADETAGTKSSLRQLLKGYNFVVELGPSSIGGPQGKPVRLTILGRIVDKPGESPASGGFASVTGGAPSETAAGQGTGTPSHPIVQALETIARSTLPMIAGDQGPTAAGNIPQSGPSQLAGAGSDPANNAADMAALTAKASANVSALVAGLKAACPAGSRC